MSLRKWLGPYLTLLVVAAALTTASLMLPQVASAVDDYPSNLRSAPLDSLVDPWNFYNRECTSFVAWRMNRDVPGSFTNHMGGRTWGNATNWGATARALGYVVDNTPAVGAIAWYSSGHVAYVEAISGSTLTIEDYNHFINGYSGPTDGAYHRYQQAASSVTGFIHFHDRPSEVRYNPVAPGDPGFTKGGAASGWTSFAGGLYGTAIYTYVNNVARDNWGRWTFDLSRLNGTAYYKLEAYIPSTHAGTRSADYHVNTSSGVQHRTVNQYATTGWTDLGTHALSAGSAWVELDDLTGEAYAVNEDHQIAFDAIRATYVGPILQPAALSVVGAVTLPSGTHRVGDTITGSFVVQNTGGQSGTWTPLVLAFRGPSGENRDALASSSITLAAGETKTVAFSRKLDLAGNWTGFVSGMFGATIWQSPAGATVALSVQPALPKANVYTPVAPSTMYRGRSATIYGYVAPKHSSGTYLVTLKFYLKNSSGTYVYHHSVNSKRYYYSSAKTKYKSYTSLPHRGRWRVRAYHSCASHSGSYSGYDYITVK